MIPVYLNVYYTELLVNVWDILKIRLWLLCHIRRLFDVASIFCKKISHCCFAVHSGAGEVVFPHRTVLAGRLFYYSAVVRRHLPQPKLARSVQLFRLFSPVPGGVQVAIKTDRKLKIKERLAQVETQVAHQTCTDWGVHGVGTVGCTWQWSKDRELTLTELAKTRKRN